MAAQTAKRTMTMSWDGLAIHSDDESDDLFFESQNRISSVDSALLNFSSSDEDDDFDDSRLSFASAVSSASAFSSVPRQPSSIVRQPSSRHGQPSSVATASSSADQSHHTPMGNYDVWMAAPGSIKERRKRLLQGMGINSTKDFFRLTTMRLVSKKFEEKPHPEPSSTSDVPPPAISAKPPDRRKELPPQVPQRKSPAPIATSPSTSASPSSPHPVLYRSRSDGDMELDSFYTKSRREEIIGSNVSKHRLTRTSSTFAPFVSTCRLNADATTISRRNQEREVGGGDGVDGPGNRKDHKGNGPEMLVPPASNGNQLTAFFLIKNLDTGKEFVVKEFDQHGMWNRLRDLQTGKQLTMEEFEKTVGHSPVVKELMRRQNADHGEHADGERKLSSLSKRFRYSKKRGASLFKNIKSSVTSGFNAEKEIDAIVQQHQKPVSSLSTSPSKSISPSSSSPSSSSDWVKVRQQGKAVKELTALRLCQEIRAHEGSIWTMKFNLDGKYLASAGEDRVIHVWEVQECEIAASRALEDGVCTSPDTNIAPDFTSGPLDRKKKWKLASKKGGIIPDYVQLPDTVFQLSEKPFCTLIGHLDDVLDISWSRSQFQLLSSSMDKTVRLWDLETADCLRLFSHNDYVTCIQFNPVDDDYFISGSLDAKFRIWSIPGRRVVHWDDLHEMVTAACYTPDGQTAVVGSHKGSCRMYSTADGKLTQISHFDLPSKKKKTAKITGFEFAHENPSEVLITSADSRIRIYDGTEQVQKFMGFRNTSSQITASYSPCGKHVICASEDSTVYIWKRDEHHRHNNINNAPKGKTYVHIRAHEQFSCKDVSVAIPWPGSRKLEPPTIPLHPKKASKRYSQQLHLSDSPTKSEAGLHGRKHQLPPLPRKLKNVANAENGVEEKTGAGLESPEDDGARIGRTDSGLMSMSGESSYGSSSMTGASIREGDSPSSASWTWSEGGHGGETMQATGWGLVIVTAGLGGEIRAYQNFGLPVRVGRR